MRSKFLKSTVSVAIPAHNEEANIVNLLESIVNQKITTFKLEGVFITNDGSTDNTVDEIKKYTDKYNIIQLVDDGKRTGKATRLNNFYEMINSDILVSFDADVVLSHRRVLENIVAAFDERKIGLVGGYDEPVEPSNWVERMCTTWIYVWDHIRTNLDNPNCVHNHMGRISASRRDLYKQIRYEPDIVDDDPYLYFKARELGFDFKFAPGAKVYYRVPSNLSDFFRQFARSITAKHRVADRLGEWIYEDHSVSFFDKLKALWLVFKREPIYLPVSVIFNVAQRIYMKLFYSEDFSKGVWIQSGSTKRPVIREK